MSKRVYPDLASKNAAAQANAFKSKELLPGNEKHRTQQPDTLDTLS